ncbi:MAG: ATP-binding cassette domain-containing protein, partial [Rhodothermales bacterium]
EVARAIAGAEPADSGRVIIAGRPVRIRSSRQARALGIDLLPEDRRDQGLLLNRSLRENVGVGSLAKRTSFGVIRSQFDLEEVQKVAKQVDLRYFSLDQEAGTLSGGNQQKLLLARTLAAQPQVLIFDEPTRGVDVGAKREIWQLIRELADSGKAVLVISSEIEEVLALSDRILVMRAGRLAAEFSGVEATEELIARAAIVETVDTEVKR